MRISRASRLLAAGVTGAVLASAVLFRPAPQVGDRPAPALPDGPLRVVAFGTSLTARNGWPDRFAAAFETCRGAQVELIRVAMPGKGSDWGLTALPEVIAAEPDLVLIEFSINDADMRDGVSLRQSRSQHDAILSQLRSARPDAALVLMTMSPAYGLRGLTRPRLGHYYAAYGPLSVEHDTGLVDLNARWMDLPRPDRKAPDGLHPTDEQTQRLIDPALTAYFGCT